MATNLNYNVNVNAANGVQALNNLQNKVQSLNGAFDGLRNAVAGIAFGAVIRSLTSFANNLKDLSDVTGLATTEILGFQKAVQEFGGSADVADKALLRLVQNVGDARSGSEQLQEAFARVGVSLNDLATLDEKALLQKTIEGISKVQDLSVQASLKAQLLGKEFRNVSLSGLVEYANKAAAENAKLADSIDKADEASKKFEKAMDTLKLKLLEVLEPLADLITKLDDKALKDSIETFLKLAAAVAAIAGIGAATKALVELRTLFVGITATVGGLILNIIKFGTIIGRILTGVGVAAAALATIFPETAKKVADGMAEATRAVKEFFGFDDVKDITPQTDANTESINKNTEAKKNNIKTTVEMPKAVKDLISGIDAVSGKYEQYTDDIIKNLQAQRDNIGLTAEQVKQKETEEKITGELQKRIKELTDAREKYKGSWDKSVKDAVDAEIKALEAQAAAAKKNADEIVSAIERKTAAQKLSEFVTRTQIDVENQLMAIQDEIAKSTMSEIEKKYYDIERAAQRSAKAAIEAEEARRGTKLSPAEAEEYYQKARKGVEELKRATQVSYESSRTFSAGWKRALNEYVDNATNAAKRAESIFKKATTGMEDLIVGFAKTGKFEWKNFVAMMLEELLRAQIQTIFASLLSDMSGAMGGGGGGGGILGAIGGLFGGGNEQDSGGGILDTIGGLFGMGGGGGVGSSANNPMYVIDVGGGMGGGGFGGMGGQQGTGIWDSIKKTAGDIWDGVTGAASSVWEGVKSIGGGVWDAVSSVGGGVWDAVSSVGSGIGSAIGGIADSIGGLFSGGGGGGGGSWLGDIASGIGDFFGGFFANGGMLGAGKWGIAGENGPEMISGPAQVTPMDYGTNVTYNINAVDAMSFKQMLAQDPSFIYGLTLQGSKGIPARR